MEAEFFLGPPPPDKQAQLKKAVADAAAAKVSADQAVKVVLDFASDKLPPLPPQEDEDDGGDDANITEMALPSGGGVGGAIAAMRRLGEAGQAFDAVEAWKAKEAAKNAPKIILPGGQENPGDQELEITNEILDPDDPTFLLEQELGLLPGVSKSRAGKMAKGSRAGMHNLTITAQRKYDLEMRAARQQAMGGKGKKGRRGK